MRYIRNVLGLANQVIFWVKAAETFEEKIPAFSKELENNFGIYFCLFFLNLLCFLLVYSVDIL